MTGPLQDTARRLRDAAAALDALCSDGEPQTRKDELLRHYGEGEPALFVQFDADAPGEHADGWLLPDNDGHCVSWGETYELRRSNLPVRLQIRSGTDAATALALLRKIVAAVESVAKEAGENAFHLNEQAFVPRPAAALADGELDGIPF